MSDCSCITVDVDDYCDVSSQNIRKARKQHKCGECSRIIERGENYEETTTLFDGHWSRNRTCVDCLSVRDAFFCNGYYFEEVWDDVREHIRNCAHTTPTEALARLTPKARETVCELIEEEWAELDD